VEDGRLRRRDKAAGRAQRVAGLPLVAVDGRFDESVEKWKLTTAPLAADDHKLEVQGTTGEPAGFVKQVSASP